MARVYRTIRSLQDRALIKGWIDKAPDLTVIELLEPKRSNAQNARLWAMLSDVQRQKPKHNGMKMTTSLGKAVFLNALGHETKFMPTLDGTKVFPVGQRSSELSKKEMGDLFELMQAWAAENGVEFNDKEDLND